MENLHIGNLTLENPINGKPTNNINKEITNKENNYNKSISKKESIEERKAKFYNSLLIFEDLLGNQLEEFYSYWTEPSSNGKLRFEKQEFFDIRRRIATWMSRSKSYDKSSQGRLQQMISQKDSVINLLNQAYGTGNDQ